jgi:hypothetical protein
MEERGIYPLFRQDSNERGMQSDIFLKKNRKRLPAGALGGWKQEFYMGANQETSNQSIKEACGVAA